MTDPYGCYNNEYQEKSPKDNVQAATNDWFVYNSDDKSAGGGQSTANNIYPSMDGSASGNSWGNVDYASIPAFSPSASVTNNQGCVHCFYLK